MAANALSNTSVLQSAADTFGNVSCYTHRLACDIRFLEKECSDGFIKEWQHPPTKISERKTELITAF